MNRIEYATKTPYQKIHQRFWSKVNKTKTCWFWTAYKAGGGYGRFGVSAKVSPQPAHRISWMLAYGEVPDGFCVLHKCDNPSCVRPDHLFLGTLKDNSQDMVRKGRDRSQGSKNLMSKLNEKQVLEIRRLSKSGTKGKDLAENYGVTTAMISGIINRKSWLHI